MGPSEIHRPLIGSPGPGPMYRLIPPLIGRAWHDTLLNNLVAIQREREKTNEIIIQIHRQWLNLRKLI